MKNTRRMLLLMMLGAVLACGLPGRAIGQSGNDTPTVTLGSDSVSPGEGAVIAIEYAPGISQAGGTIDAIDVSFEIAYTADLYQSVDLSQCTANLSQPITGSCDLVAPGTIAVRFFNTQGGIIQEQSIGHLVFQVAASATPQTDALALSSPVFLDSDFIPIDGTLVDGQITITAAPEIHAGEGSGAPFDTVDIPLEYVAGGHVTSLRTNLLFNPALYSEVDLSNCAGNAQADAANCIFQNEDPSTGIIEIHAENLPTNTPNGPIPAALLSSQSLGSIAFTIAPGIAPQDDPLIFDQPQFSGARGAALGVLDNGLISIIDPDGDGIPNPDDNCPDLANGDQADSDGEGVGDACDNCIDFANADQVDSDQDGFGNQCDVIGPLPTLALCEDTDPAPVGFAADPMVHLRPILLDAPLATLALADFDADGSADVVATGGLPGQTGRLSVWRASGAGGYRLADALQVGQQPVALASADFNRDGWPDLAVANRGSGDVSIVLNNAKGGFAPAQPLAIDDAPGGLAVLDIDADGDPDLALAAAATGKLTLLSNRGDGHLAAHASYQIGNGPLSLVRGDFDGDGRTDLAVLERASGRLSILFNTPGNGFLQAETAHTVARPTAMVAGDFDGDHDTGLAIAVGDKAVVWLDNSASGSHFQRHRLDVPFAPEALVAADLDNDGRSDLAASGPSSRVALWLASANGGFHSPRWLATGHFSRQLQAADVNADGHIDLMTLHAREPVASLLINRGDGRFFDLRSHGARRHVGEAAPGRWLARLADSATIRCQSADPTRVVADDPASSDKDEGPTCTPVSRSNFELSFALVADANSVDVTPLVQLTAVDDATSQTRSEAVLSGSIEPVNDPPSFTAGPDIATRGDAGMLARDGWASAISAGPANEAQQQLQFVLTPDHPDLFAADGAPIVDPATGRLSYVLAAGAAGSTTVNVVLVDNGPAAGSGSGRCTGNLNRSDTASFVITAYPVTTLQLAGLASNGVEPGTRRVHLDIANTGSADTLELTVTATPPPGVEILAVYNEARGCQATAADDGTTGISCADPDGAGFQCHVADNTASCTLPSFPQGAEAGLVIQTSAGSGDLDAKATAINADAAAALIPLGG